MKWWCDRRLLPVSVVWLGLRPTRFLYLLAAWEAEEADEADMVDEVAAACCPGGVGLPRLAICLQEATTIRNCVTSSPAAWSLDDGHLEYFAVHFRYGSISISKALVRSGKARFMYRVHTL